MRIEDRVAGKVSMFRPSLTLGLKDLVEDRRARGLPVFDFGLGETKGDLPAAVREAGERAFREGDTMYGDPAGTPGTRAAVIRWLGLEASHGPDEVVVTAGAKQALLHVFLATCDPGDVVLFDAAPWVSYQPIAVCAGAVPVMVLPRDPAATRLKVTADDLRRNLRMRPWARLFLLNNPVNPTGQLYDASEIESLLRVCVEHRVFLVLDRLYWRIVFDGRPFPVPRLDAETSPWVIQVDGMSKNFRRTGGMRLGWSVAPPDIARAMASLQGHTSAGPSVPVQRAARAALDGAYDDGLLRELHERRDAVERLAREIPGVEAWPSQGAFYSFWDVRGCLGKRPPGGQALEDSDAVAAYLVREAGVVTASGGAFLQDGFLRISFAVPEATVVVGMAAAREALGRLR
jgi:aspartate aminotransferase